ncbi:MAG: nicotinate phosphoribosyltransferase [Acidobacteriota bacterium]
MTQRSISLATDLYQMTMAAAYFDNGLHHQKALFELFVRALPRSRSYLISAGLEPSLDYLRSLRFTSDQIEYLREHPSFSHVSREFFDYLREFRFTGDVWAVREGTAAFAMEPVLRLSAPVIEAQIVETFLLATMNFQTMIASKAARVVSAACGRSVIEFGTRRAHGSEAGLMAARAAYIGGCAGTSNVEAGFLFGLPTFGTMAHSFVMLMESEDDAFRAFLRVFPDTATILVDTYDTLAAVHRLADNFEERLQAVRLDSGDLTELSKRAREILDAAGKTDVKIFASSDLDEYRIDEMLREGARIDAFGVGTQMATSYDAAALSGVYKLVGLEKDGRVEMRVKLSPGKATYPGAKQIWRRMNEAGRYAEDLITFADEDKPDGDWNDLLRQVMKRGEVVEPLPASREESRVRLDAARARAMEEMKRLPAEILALDSRAQFPVRFSDRLTRERERLQNERKREE